MTDKASRMLNTIRRNDRERMQQMTSRLQCLFAERGLETDVDEQAVIDMIAGRHGSSRETIYVQERHVSQAFQEALHEKIPAEDRIAQLNTLLGGDTQAGGPEDAVGIQNDIRSHLMKAGKPAFVDEKIFDVRRSNAAHFRTRRYP